MFLREVIFSLWLWKDLLLVMQEHCGLCLLHIPPVLPLPRQIWHLQLNCFYWVLQPLLQWRGSHCMRLWQCACVCAEVHCMWMGGHADTQPNAVVDFYEWAVSGYMVGFFSSLSLTIFISHFAVHIQDGHSARVLHWHDSSHLRTW